MPKGNRRKQVRNKRGVPYIKGFKCPTPKDQLKAIGAADDKSRHFTLGTGFFDPISKCSSENDWLAQYSEPRQSYQTFVRECPWLSRRKVKSYKGGFVSDGSDLPHKYPGSTIYILPLGDFTTQSDCIPAINKLVKFTKIFYGLPVKVLSGVNLDITDSSIHWVHEDILGKDKRSKLFSRHQDGHSQLRIDSGLQKLKGYMPEDGLCMIALTMCDLYEARSDIFVAGMAAGNQRVAIFSLFRYNPCLDFSGEFWYQYTSKYKFSTEEKTRLILQRSCRLLVHELGHLLGIGHCVYYNCLMNGSGHLEEDFRQPMFLCPVDLHKIQALCGIDLSTRYASLRDFYSENGMQEEKEWTIKRLDFINL